MSVTIFITHMHIVRNGRYADVNGIGSKRKKKLENNNNKKKSQNKTTTTTWHAHSVKDPLFTHDSMHVFFFACQYLCKQFESRPVLTFVVPNQHLDTLMVFLYEVSKNNRF